MLLKHVYLFLNLDEYPDDLTTPFGFRTRYVCNFLERRLQALRYHAQGFSRICIQGRHRPLDVCPIVFENAALPTVVFDEARYLAMQPGDEHEFFIAMIEDGLERCAKEHSIPLPELRAALGDFRRGGYRNEWLHQSKLLRPIGLQASLLCAMDSERFRLTLKIERKDVVVFDQKILETEPDELIFTHKFKEVALSDGAIIVRDKFGKSVFSVSVDSLVL